MTAVTPGQAAHRRWHETRWPESSTPEAIAKEWEVLSGRAAAAWEAAATGSSAPGLRDELAEARELGTGWRQERDGHRAHLAEILDSYQQTGIGCVSRKTTVQVIREKLRAGLDVTDKERRMAGG